MNQQRSIFHLGEEGDDGAPADHHGKNSVVDIHRHLGCSRRRRRGRDPAADAHVVGLQILVQQQHRHHPQLRHVVLKQMVCPPPPRHSFLRACSLCRRELSSDKEVYMYRGEQGFCSEECRRKQILTDHAREREAMEVPWNRRGPPHRRRYHGQRLSPPTIGGGPRKLLAVA